MKMKTRLASLLAILATSGPLLSATEVERLRALCAEQEMQIRQLEIKIARLTDTPPPSHASAPSAASARDFETVTESASTYTVKSGDSIERIARRNGTTAPILNKLNGLNTASLIHPGQKIKLPGNPAVASKSSAPSPSPSVTTRTHAVQSGETFYSISRKYDVSVDKLISANPGVNHRALRIGQKIKISTPAPTVASAPASGPSLAPVPSRSILNSPAPFEKLRASGKPIKIDKEISYGLFAKNHNTTSKRLDELNGLELDPTTILAQGSELYIPAQP